MVVREMIVMMKSVMMVMMMMMMMGLHNLQSHLHGVAAGVFNVGLHGCADWRCSSGGVHKKDRSGVCVCMSSLVAVGSTRSEHDRCKPREIEQDKRRWRGAQVKERVEQKLCACLV